MFHYIEDSIKIFRGMRKNLIKSIHILPVSRLLKLYTDLTEIYIEITNQKQKYIYTLCMLLSSKNETCMYKYARFVYKIFKLRKENL